MSINYDFLISNYTDRGEKWDIKSSFFEVIQSINDTNILVIQILLSGHISYEKLVHTKSDTLRKKIQKALLTELDKIQEINPDDHKTNEGTIDNIMMAITSWRWYETYNKKRILSPNGTSKTEKYKFWFDGTPIDLHVNIQHEIIKWNHNNNPDTIPNAEKWDGLTDYTPNSDFFSAAMEDILTTLSIRKNSK
jgi:hypothetical protein